MFEFLSLTNNKAKCKNVRGSWQINSTSKTNKQANKNNNKNNNKNHKAEPRKPGRQQEYQ